MKSVGVVLLLLSLSGVLSQEFASECPEANGFFADAVQCDKYYSCKDGVLTEKLCDDGLIFNDDDPRIEKCDFPLHVKCDGRELLQTPQPSENCPRRNGYFTPEDTTICDEFYYCHDGIPSHVTCPESLVFSLKTANCVWSNEAGRTGCKAKNLLNFTCPTVPFDVAVAHPRYPDVDDCQFFYVCINGETPRRNGCTFGTVFNNATKTCDQPVNVPDCENYYKEYFENYFANLGANTKALTPEIIAAAVGSGFKIPERPKRVQISLGPKPIRRRPTFVAPTSGTGGETVIVQSQRKPTRRRRPIGADSTRRRRPVRRRTTTTTTTTEAPLYYDDDEYYYYDDEVVPQPKETLPAAPKV